MLLLCLALSDSSVGAEILTLKEAEDLALVNEPGTAALEAQQQAYQDLAIAVGQLPDPQIQIGAANYPIETGSFRQEGMSHIRIGLRQNFPSAQGRKSATEYQKARSSELSHLIQERKRKIKNNVRLRWLGVFYENRAEEIIHASLVKLRDLHDVTRSLYAVGLENQTVLLKLDLEMSRMKDKISASQERQKIIRSKLSQWIHEAAMRPLPIHEPSIPEIGDLSALQVLLAHHPLIRTAEANIAASLAEIRMAESQFRPSFSSEVSYSLRDGELPNGESRSDFLSLILGIQLPMFTAKRQDQQWQAALQRSSAAKLQRIVVIRGLQSRLLSTYEQFLSLNERIDRYRTEIVPQMIEYANVAVTSYQSEVGDYKEVIDSQRLALQVQLEMIQLVVERVRVWAELNYLTDTNNAD